MTRWMLAAAWLLCTPSALAEPTMVELLNATDDFARGESSKATLQMQVKTPRYERTMTMEAYSKGTEKSLIRILSPTKDAGISTLKVDDNIWNYLPKVDRTMKVPGAMMSGNWMGSHFTNDDLVKSSRLSDDFEGQITTRPSDGPDAVYTVELTPKPDAAIVWGQVVVRVNAEMIPVDVRYFEEDGALARTMSFSDVKNFDGQSIPSRMRLQPADDPDSYTEIVYTELKFNVALDDSDFSLQALKR